MKKVSTTGNNHIVQLIGCILSEAPMAMIMEYSPFGDLHSNLLTWKDQVCIMYYGKVWIVLEHYKARAS